MTSLARHRRESAHSLSGVFLRETRLVCDMMKSKVIRIDSEKDGFRRRRCLFFQDCLLKKQRREDEYERAEIEIVK